MVKHSGTHHAKKAIHDACYYNVKRRYAVWPSARASQALAKCRKSHGHVHKSEKGAALKRWGKEKWKTTSGKACGSGGTQYCRPTKKVSKETPKTMGSMSKKKRQSKLAEKRRVGMGHKVSKA
jgi:hypothetical protein